MDITFNCPKCNGSLVVDAAGVGRSVPCPFCQKIITIPQSTHQSNEQCPPSLPKLKAGDDKRESNAVGRKKLVKWVVGCFVIIIILGSCLMLENIRRNCISNPSIEKNTPRQPKQETSDIPIMPREERLGERYVRFLNSLDKEAGEVALKSWNIKRIGDSYYIGVTEKWADQRCHDYGRNITEMRKVRVEVYPSIISEADKLNGFEWRGQVELGAEAFRQIELSVLPSRNPGGYSFSRSPSRKWSDWQSGLFGSPARVKLATVQKKNGHWDIHQDSCISLDVWGVGQEFSFDPVETSEIELISSEGQERLR